MSRQSVTESALSDGKSPGPRESAVPSVEDVDLTIVFPAYNEEFRLPVALESARAHFAMLPQLTYEVIVVDDGSGDGTRRIVEELARGWPELRIVSYAVNRGKGFAVRTGVQAASGDYILFADADGATPISEELKLREALRHGADIAVGSRSAAARGVRRRRTLLRQVSSALFAVCTRCILPVGVSDSQCGFKMFRRHAAQRLFAVCDEDRFLFDLFILRMARLWHFAVAEVPVSWTEVPGSKVRLIADSLAMFHRLWDVRRRTAQVFSEQSGADCAAAEAAAAEAATTAERGIAPYAWPRGDEAPVGGGRATLVSNSAGADADHGAGRPVQCDPG